MAGAEFYTPTQQFSAPGFTIAVIGGALATVALGFAYGCVQVVQPILYVSFVVTLFFATVLGHGSILFLKLGQVRNRGVATAVAIVGALAGLYGAWVADRWVRPKMLRIEGVDLSFAPTEVLRYMGFFLENGLWTFRAQPVNGLPLLMIWLAEAGIVFALAVKLVRARSREWAYCEGCRRWATSFRGVRSVGHARSHGLTKELKLGNVQPLLQELALSGGAPLALRVDLDRCPTCSESIFLSLTVVAGGSRFRQFVWPEEKALIRHLRISPADADALKAPQDLAQLRAAGKPPPPKN